MRLKSNQKLSPEQKVQNRELRLPGMRIAWMLAYTCVQVDKNIREP
jgi:hypothetical protein